MKLYVVSDFDDYYSDDVLGVFTSLEDLFNSIDVRDRKHFVGREEYLYVTECVLNNSSINGLTAERIEYYKEYQKFKAEVDSHHACGRCGNLFKEVKFRYHGVDYCSKYCTDEEIKGAD